MTAATWEAKANALQCKCWDCLRRAGLTPPQSEAAKHPDILGNVYRSYDGSLAHGRKHG